MLKRHGDASVQLSTVKGGSAPDQLFRVRVRVKVRVRVRVRVRFKVRVGVTVRVSVKVRAAWSSRKWQCGFLH